MQCGAARGKLLSVVVILALSISAIAVWASGASAIIAPDGDRVSEETLDVRDEAGKVQPDETQIEASRTLIEEAGSGTRIDWDERFGTPRKIMKYQGYLSGPNSGSAVEVARGWLNENRGAFGLSEADVADLNVQRDNELPGTGTRVVSFQQVFEGVETAQGGRLTVAVAEEGRVLSFIGDSIRGGSLAGGFSLSAADALSSVAGEIAPQTGFTPNAAGEEKGWAAFERGPFAAQSYVRKAAFPTADGARPAFRVLFIKELDEAYEVIVDAETGETLFRTSLVDNQLAESEGTIYENYPGAPGGGEPVIKSFGPNEQSPSGYTDPTGLAGVGGPTTFGNNADTYANWSNFLVPADQAPRPVSPTSQFNYSYANNWGRSEGETVPPSYAKDLDPAATNLFYHHNRIHDDYYALGFTEESGNFQVNNNGNGGSGGDPVLGLVQAGAASGGEETGYTGRDNAYMLTLPDGLPSWSGMFLWEPINDAFEGPYRDGDMDVSVIQHEVTHGLTTRYVAGGESLNSSQSGAMGEGWSDWYALDYLYKEGLDDRTSVGIYVTGNEERGIRNWSRDEAPVGFGDIGYDIVGPQVHADGEIWSAILWDMRQALVEQYGEEEGGEIARRIVTDAMPLTAPNPSFLDARDGIIKALDNRYHARDDYDVIFDIVFTEFAQRGAGFQASSETGDDTDPTPAFDHSNTERNGTLAGEVVNASTGEPIEGARVMIGVFEGRVSPLRETSGTGEFSAPVVDGAYPVTIQARGFGSRTFEDVRVREGRTRSLTFEMAPNLTSEANGAEVVSSTSPGAEKIMDDTEASSWSNEEGGNAVIKLAKPSKVSSLQVSAYTSSRFEALKSFTFQTSTDGRTWKTRESGEAFSYQKPRPTSPDVTYKTFTLDNPVKAKFVRFWTDEPMGDTKDAVQVGDLQVFSSQAQGVEPAPPPPPDEPVADEGAIEAGTPVGDATSGGVTAVDFQNTCAFPPSTQGSDGWVTELPDSFGDGAHNVRVEGTGAAPHDLDLYFYNADCEVVGSAASPAADESGTLPSGAKYILTHLYTGANESFELTATDTR